jgi:hypothetical protein
MTLSAKGYLCQILGRLSKRSWQVLDEPSHALMSPEQDGPACGQTRFDTESMGDERRTRSLQWSVGINAKTPISR